MLTITTHDEKRIAAEVDVLGLLEKFTLGMLNYLSVMSVTGGVEKTLNLRSSNGFFLISGFDGSTSKHFTIRESKIEGQYEIGDGIWSGIYLTQEIEKVRKVFSLFVEKQIFDEDILSCDDD